MAFKTSLVVSSASEHEEITRTRAETCTVENTRSLQQPVHRPGSRDLLVVRHPAFTFWTFRVPQSLPSRHHHHGHTRGVFANAIAIADACKLTGAYTSAKEGVKSIEGAREVLCEGNERTRRGAV